MEIIRKIRKKIREIFVFGDLKKKISNTYISINISDFSCFHAKKPETRSSSIHCFCNEHFIACQRRYFTIAAVVGKWLVFARLPQ